MVHYARALRIARLVLREPLFELLGGSNFRILGARKKILHVYGYSEAVVGVIGFQLAFRTGGFGYEDDVGLYPFEPPARHFPKFNGNVGLRVGAVSVNVKLADKMLHI